MSMWLKNRARIGWQLAWMLSLIGSIEAQAEGWGENTRVGDLAVFELAGDIPEIEGKVTLIDFWASWCAPCKAAFPEMEKLYRKYKDEGFQILAVSVDQKAQLMERFLERQKPSFATAHDANQLMVKSAQIEVMPSSFLIDRKGIVRFNHEGWHGDKSVESLNEQIKTLLDE